MKTKLMLMMLSAMLAFGQGGTWTKSKTTTGPRGKTATSRTQASYSGGSATATTVKTGPNGKSTTTTRSRMRTQN